jgi:hypothetical protein
MPVALNVQLRVQVADRLVQAVPPVGMLMQVADAGPVSGSQDAGVVS